VRSWLDAGEVFVRRRPRFLDEGLPVPMQPQIIEAEQVPLLDVTSYRGLPEGHRICSGIELDKRNKRVAYWIYKEHPSDGMFRMGLPDERVRVAASEICHIFEPKRPGQLRGVSMLAPMLNRLKNIENSAHARSPASADSSCRCGYSRACSGGASWMRWPRPIAPRRDVSLERLSGQARERRLAGKRSAYEQKKEVTIVVRPVQYSPSSLVAWTISLIFSAFSKWSSLCSRIHHSAASISNSGLSFLLAKKA
jgi:hypothetical protein